MLTPPARLKKSSRVQLLIVLIISRLALDLSSFYLIFPLYSYAGLSLDLSVPHALFSWFCYFALAVFVVLSKSSIYPAFFLFFIFLPVSSFYLLTSKNTSVFLSIFVATLFLSAVSQLRLNIKAPKNGSLYFRYLSLTILFAYISLFFLRNGWSYFSLDVSKLYEHRENLKSLYSGVLSYVLVWSIKVILPTLLSMSVARRKIISSTLIVLAMVMIFFVTFRKEVFVYCLLGFWIGVYITMGGRFVALGMLKCVMIVTFLIFSISLISGNMIYFAAFLQRAFVVVGQNLNDYVQFFSNNEYLYFSQSFLKSFVDDPYGRPVPEIIGYGRWGAGTETFANAGIWASAFMQMGYAGILLYALIAASIACFFSNLEYKITDNANRAGALTALLCGLLQLVNADLLTAILTHGLGISMLVVWFLSSRKASRVRFFNSYS